MISINFFPASTHTQNTIRFVQLMRIKFLVKRDWKGVDCVKVSKVSKFLYFLFLKIFLKKIAINQLQINSNWHSDFSTPFDFISLYFKKKKKSFQREDIKIQWQMVRRRLSYTGEEKGSVWYMHTNSFIGKRGTLHKRKVFELKILIPSTTTTET